MCDAIVLFQQCQYRFVHASLQNRKNIVVYRKIYPFNIFEMNSGPNLCNFSLSITGRALSNVYPVRNVNQIARKDRLFLLYFGELNFDKMTTFARQ